MALTGKLYRFKFSDEIVNELTYFSNMHKFESRADYKESWQNWLSEKRELIERETDRLTELGYEGNVIDKMYKSARYYFGKKSNTKTEPKKRRIYLTIPKNILNLMDAHIKSEMENRDYKPSKGFKDFMETHYYDIKQTQDDLHEKKELSQEDITYKFKKTYNNRYYIHKVKSNPSSCSQSIVSSEDS